MSLRGLNTRHSVPLIETRFAGDPLQWTQRPKRWPLPVRIVAAFILNGLAWAAVLFLLFEIHALLRSL